MKEAKRMYAEESSIPQVARILKVSQSRAKKAV